MNTTTWLEMVQTGRSAEGAVPAFVVSRARTRSETLRFVFLLAGITLLAGALRLYRLDSASFWVDELNTVRGCLPLADMHRSKLLGYLPTWVGMWASGADMSGLSAGAPELWRSKGVTEWSARIGSCLIGILTIPILALASRRFVGGRVALILALLLAVAPWHIYWSQASRFYTLQFLFYSLCLIWYFTATRDGSRGWLAAALACGVLAFLSQPPALVIAGVLALDWLLGLRRSDPIRLGLFGWTAIVLCLVLCAAVLSWDVKGAPAQWTQFAGDLYQSPTKMILGAAYMIGPAIVFFAAISAAHRLRSGWDRRTVYLVLAAVLPLLVFAALSTRSYVGLRYTFVCLFAFLVLAAIGAEEVYVRLQHHGRLLAIAPTGLLLVSMMLMNYGYFTGGAGFHTRWRDAFAYVAAHRSAADGVCTTAPMIGRYYLEDASVQSVPKEFHEIQTAQHPIWIVTEPEDSVRGDRLREWMRERLDLKARFDLYVVQPRSSVHVYRYAAAAERSDQREASNSDEGLVLSGMAGTP